MKLLNAIICAALALVYTGCAKAPRRNLIPYSETVAGFNEGTFDRLDRTLHLFEEYSEIPGGSLAIVWRGEPIYLNFFGTEANGPDSGPISAETKFELASLTKPIAGVSMAWLMAKDIDNPDDLQMLGYLLSHQTLLNDETDFRWIIGSMLDEKDPTDALLNRAGGKSKCHRYANSNYALLALLANKQNASSRDDLQNLWTRLGVGGMSFTPDVSGSIAASGWTANDELIRGQPFDPLASVMINQGIAPLHSGLFANSLSAALFASRIMTQGRGSEFSPLSELLFGDAFPVLDCESGKSMYISPGGLVSPTEPPFAKIASQPGTYYMQKGYTGCLLWVEKGEGLSVVLLTNASLNEAWDDWEALSEQTFEIILQGRRR